MSRLFAPALLILAFGLSAQTPFFPIADLKPGMRGIGKTVFAGDRIDDFQVEILGLLENVGPKQSLILARLSGGPLERTGVLQGMSGSPVYIDGKLLGAVAMAFPYSKEPIAGIRPIGEMLRVGEAGAAMPQRPAATLADKDVTRWLSKRQEALAGDARMVDVATPVSFGGFTRATMDEFAPQLQALGLEPRQALGSGGRVDARMGLPSALKPGSMISVELMTGDMSISADGTVTHIDGKNLYAFGHRFLAVGATALPFARSEVVTLLPILSTSFKISTPKEMMGAIFQDRSTAILGELGRSVPLVPVSVAVSRAGRRLENYEMRMVDDHLLSPLLVQLVVFSSIDATERTVGEGSFRLSGQIEFHGGAAPLRIDNIYAADNGAAMIASLSTAVPLAFVLQSGFDALHVKKVSLEIESFDEKKQLLIDQVSVARPQVRAGEKVELRTVLTGDNGVEVVRKVEYAVPVGALPGPLFFTVADGNTTNLTEYRQTIGNPAHSIAQLLSMVNNLRSNRKAYVRVWRADAAFQIGGTDLPAPPPSVSMVLTGSQSLMGGISQTRNSKIAEIEIAAGDMMITGSKTVQVEVKE